MPRLSIIVVHSNTVERLEQTLGSLLRDRPNDCEMIVVHPGTYDDPHDLKEELRFVEVTPLASRLDAINAGIEAARGEVVHLLETGTEVDEGWADGPMMHFADGQVGSVTPVILNASDREHVINAGVRVGFGGTRVVCGAGIDRTGLKGNRLAPPLGPSLAAGFFRRAALQSLGGFDPSVGERLADVDMSLSLRAIGYASLLAPECRIYAHETNTPAGNSFREGQAAERFYWRHAPQRGWLGSVLQHPWAVIYDFLSSGLRLGTLVRLAGRIAGFTEATALRRYYRLLDEARSRKPSETVVTIPERPPHRRAA